ncbi:GNAT family N-acetyltransferase [Bacillus sp. SCS-153A]|uniref:GNAT family N-acetyltransferase n=1 Tax=Rossellomorea sedimentorum TaxID=3115294 RepID=UPI0039060590
MAGHCLVAREDEAGGFLIFNTHFFECAFISLVIVSPSKRRRGVASRLIESLIEMSPTSKVFSSTNRSNHTMQHVFDACGFKPSGIVENLDEGDPELIYFKSAEPMIKDEEF